MNCMLASFWNHRENGANARCIVSSVGEFVPSEAVGNDVGYSVTVVFGSTVGTKDVEPSVPLDVTADVGVKEGAGVRVDCGAVVDSVPVGKIAGPVVGRVVEKSVGDSVGFAVGWANGLGDGLGEGGDVGPIDCDCVGCSIGRLVGKVVG